MPTQSSLAAMASAIGVLLALEVDLGRPVLTANQVVFWHALRLSGSRLRIANYGRIFDQEGL
jgi:maleate isomerase